MAILNPLDVPPSRVMLASDSLWARVCVHSREFGRWKVNSLALERQENNGLSLPLDPEFLQTIRQLGRRPSLGAITDNIIRKYGTHFLLSATLGGK